MAEGAPLLRAYGFTPIEGSNPSLSATYFRLHAAVAQLDRVPGYEPGGRRFDSCQPHHYSNAFRRRLEMVIAINEVNGNSVDEDFAAVAQLDRVPGYEPGGRRFDSCQPHHIKKATLWGGFFFA